MSSSFLVPLPVLLPLSGAALALLFSRSRTAQRWVSGLTCLATLIVAVALGQAVIDADGTLAVQVGSWPAPFGITLAADRFTVAMVVIAALMVAVVLIYAIGQMPAETESLYFHPVYLVMAAGVAQSFLAGDLFNMFVAFEFMLIGSYVLLTLGASRAQLRTGMTYVVINLLASTLFVVSVGLLYASTGTVNMADLAVRLQEVPEHIRSAMGLLLLIVFAIKAGLFPLFFWLPDSYPSAPPPVTAIFAALLTKVGVYAIIRTQTLMFPSEGPSLLLLFVAGATMLVGVLGAVAQNEIRRILSFHIISQIGYMILGLGLYSVAGLAGGILYILHHIVVKTALFCVGGAVEHAHGTGRLSELAGTATRAPVLAALFAVPALSLAGIPPFSGFVAKLALTEAGLDQGRWVVIGVGLLVSLLTLFSMSKIWAGAFWGKLEPAAEAAAAARNASGRVPAPMLLATGVLVTVSIGIAVFAGPLYDFSAAAAADLLDTSGYIGAVLGS